MDNPQAGTHYPRSQGEFQDWFHTDADCPDYLEWLRWPGGFVCPACGKAVGWRLDNGRFMCSGCARRTSVTAGAIFDRTRTPLTVWFSARWLFAIGKDGMSATHASHKAARLAVCYLWPLVTAALAAWQIAELFGRRRRSAVGRELPLRLSLTFGRNAPHRGRPRPVR